VREFPMPGEVGGVALEVLPGCELAEEEAVWAVG
jgi:hypothetical protein